MHIYVSKINHHWFRYWLGAWIPATHYLNQSLGNKFQLNLNDKSNTLINENAVENVVSETSSILSRPQCVSGRKGMLLPSHTWLFGGGPWRGCTHTEAMPCERKLCCTLIFAVFPILVYCRKVIHYSHQPIIHRMNLLLCNINVKEWKIF